MNIKNVIKCYREGMSPYQIAKKFDTYPNKIRRALIKSGEELRDKSQAQKNALEKGVAKHPTKGKERDDKTKKKISESQAKVWKNLSEEEKIQRSMIGKKSWESKSKDERALFLSKAGEAIRQAAKEGSKMEKYLLEGLINEGFRVDFHKTQWLQNRELEVDMFLPDLQAVIEVDGPSHFEPVWGEENLAKNQRMDQQKNGLVLRSGMIMIRIRQDKRLSQKYLRDTLDKLLRLLKDISGRKLTEYERYIELW